MIKTAQQLKALVRNRSKGNIAKTQEIMTVYALERFLERLSLSEYRERVILKGGALIASLIGIDNRSTRDVDATLKNLPLSTEDVRNLVEEVIQVPLDDGVEFIVGSTVQERRERQKSSSRFYPKMKRL